MSERLNQEELGQVILEIEKMRSRNEAELTREQVEEILQELNLSPDLLDEALIQLRRKQALKAEKKRNRLIALGAVVSFLIIVSLWLFFSHRNNLAIANVQAQEDRISLGKDNGGNFQIIERNNNPQVSYQVTLKNAPIGKNLELSCNWISPNGEIVKQNRYRTRDITTSIWNTRCRYTIGASSPIGDWQVQMFLNNRKLSEADFKIK